MRKRGRARAGFVEGRSEQGGDGGGREGYGGDVCQGSGGALQWQRL